MVRDFGDFFTGVAKICFLPRVGGLEAQEWVNGYNFLMIQSTQRSWRWSKTVVCITFEWKMTQQTLRISNLYQKGIVRKWLVKRVAYYIIKIKSPILFHVSCYCSVVLILYIVITYYMMRYEVVRCTWMHPLFSNLSESCRWSELHCDLFLCCCNYAFMYNDIYSMSCNDIQRLW